MKKLRVLVGCESSGVVRDAFIAHGHDAMSCDLLPSDVGGPHHQGDLLEVLGEGWDLGIFHPPCTYLSSSGMHWTARGLRDPQLTEDALEFVAALMNAPIKRIAVENPVGAISTRICKPDQIIQPWQFGDDASKKTCLWLKNLPKLDNGDRSLWIPGRVVGRDKRGFAINRWANQTDSGQNRLGPSDDRWKQRSKTYQGIATAMAQQWG